MDDLTGFISLRGLWTLQIMIDPIYILEMVFTMDVLDVNWKAGAQFFKNYGALSY